MPGWIRVAPAKDVIEGEPIAVNAPGREIACFRVGSRIFATDNVCTHGQARLCDGYQEGHVIECPLHQGQFDVRTGACLAPPVTEPIGTHPVRIRDGFVEVEIPIE